MKCFLFYYFLTCLQCWLNWLTKILTFYFNISSFFWFRIVLHNQTYIPNNNETVCCSRDNLGRIWYKCWLSKKFFAVEILTIIVKSSYSLIPRPKKNSPINIFIIPFTSCHKFTTTILTKSNIRLNQRILWGTFLFKIKIATSKWLGIFLPYPHWYILFLSFLILNCKRYNILSIIRDI